MKQLFLTLFTAAAMSGRPTGCALAAPPAAQTGKSELVEKLEARAEQLQGAAQGTNGAHTALLQMRRVQGKQLIERIRAGKPVDPHEIDVLLHEDVHFIC
jgi:hypothetical protein